MTQPFQPVVTQAGLQAVFNSTSSGFQANVTSIGLGEEGWIPDESATSLKNEKRRIVIGSSNLISDTQIHITAIEEGDEHSYWVREVGFYLDDGTLLAIWSNPDHPIAFKAAGVDLLIAFDLALGALPKNSINVIGTGTVSLTPARTDKLGLVKYATDSEAVSGSLQDKVVTPKGQRLHGDARYAKKVHRHAWSEIDQKPSSYPPSGHRHNWSELDNKPSSYPPSSHRHKWSELDDKPATYPPSNHNHDDRYITLGTNLGGKTVYVDVQGTGNTSSSSTALSWAQAIHPPAQFGDGSMMIVVYRNRYWRGTGNGANWYNDQWTARFFKSGSSWSLGFTTHTAWWG
jgi:hypothetical protein